MGDLKNSLNSLATIIEDIVNILKNDSLTKEERITFTNLLDTSRGAFGNFARFSYDTNQQLGASARMASENASTLVSLQQIIDEISQEKQTAIDKISILNSTKMKEIQFNSYFAQTNYYNVAVMKILVVSSLLMMINIFLYTRKYTSENIYTIMSIIIISITLVIVGNMIYSEYQRTNYNFNRYNWPKPPN
jgi:hypothetical protein